MCDYSLCGVPNRLAVEREELVLHRFRTGTVGLASSQDLLPKPAQPMNFWQRFKMLVDGSTDATPVTAVCIPPGAQLLLKNIPEPVQRRFHISSEEDVVFTQASANVNTHRDAVRFCNGTQVLLHNLPTGIRAEVLSLSGTATEPERVLQSQL